MRLYKQPDARVKDRIVWYELTPESDLFGFAREVLLDALEQDIRTVHRSATDYYRFALGKAVGHRGLSASRSVTKLAEYAWLLNQIDLSVTMRTLSQTSRYAPYGVPILAKFAKAMRLEFPDEHSALLSDDNDAYRLWRMGQGWPCTPNCDEGCRQ